jgi:tetratricopeptide (TPR) repeat protein
VVGGTPGLVDIVRDFLVVEQEVRSLIARYRRGELRFAEIDAFFSDDEASALFRLKERCHALFRSGVEGSRVVRHREVLFDLAVGSLFHEAMKFRESFYQREVYGPRVRALHEEAGEEAAALFQEFEKILAAGSESLEQGLQETEELLERTREQLTVLLAEHPENGHVARFLIENRGAVEAVFVEGLDALLASVYDDPAAGYALAGRSYLASGYFEDAERALCEATARGGASATLEPPTAYARGMAAYLKGDYAESVAQLERWASAGGTPERALLETAHTATSKIEQLEQSEDRERVVAAAARLLERLAGLRRGQAAAS